MHCFIKIAFFSNRKDTWSLLSKKGSTINLRSLPYCKEVCEGVIDLAAGKGTELVPTKIFERVMFKWDSMYFKSNISYIYFAHNTQSYLNAGDSLVLRICQLPLETAWDYIHQLHSKTILYPGEVCHPAEGAIGLASQKGLVFLLQEFDFFLVCVLVMSLVLFVCFIVSLDECLQIQLSSGFATFCRNSSLKPFVLPRGDNYMVSAFSAKETR